MIKQGILHDYDLHANLEESSKMPKCAICDSYPMIFQWGDYSGEAMCIQCGCPYQLKWGSDKQKEEGKYPYLNLRDSFILVAKQYWNEKKKFVCYGMMFGPQPGMTELILWLKENYPEFIKNK